MGYPKIYTGLPAKPSTFLGKQATRSPKNQGHQQPIATKVAEIGASKPRKCN